MTRQAILDALADAPYGLRRAEIAAAIGMTPKAVVPIVRAMSDRGLIVVGFAGWQTTWTTPALRPAVMERIAARSKAQELAKYARRRARLKGEAEQAEPAYDEFCDAPPVRRVVPAGEWVAEKPGPASVFELADTA